ncbi:MAG: Maf family nucleotide pyrophosphatase [Anaerolineales bacterium]
MLEFLPVNDSVSLVLASNSPRRRQLLALGGWQFSVFVADVDESQLPDEHPAEYVLRLAEDKACLAASKMPYQAIVIAADTAVVDGSDILGKPADAQEAVRMLERLRAHTHQVYTGLALLRKSDGYALSDLTVTDVPMRDYSDTEIAAYVQTGDPLDKAGAYGIQHSAFRPVRDMKGCFASVMGLPLCRLTVLLRQFGVTPGTDVAHLCQAEIGYDCPISHTILGE